MAQLKTLSEMLREAEAKARGSGPAPVDEDAGEDRDTLRPISPIDTKPEYKKIKIRKAELQQERYVHEFVTNGFNKSAAYRAVTGTKGKVRSVIAAARRFHNKPEVQQLLLERANRLRADHQVSEDWIMMNWRNQAQANVMHYFHQDEDGNLVPRNDLTQMPTAVQQNIRKLDIYSNRRPVKEDGEVVGEAIEQRVKVEVIDSQRALECLAKTLNMYGDNSKEDEAKQRGSRLRATLELAAEQGYRGHTYRYDENGKVVTE